MTATTKFNFDTIFDLAEPVDGQTQEQEPAPPPPAYSAAELAAARAEGYAEGHQAGLSDGNTALENAAIQALNDLAAQLSSLGPICQTGLDRCHREAIGIANAVTRRTVEVFAQESALQVIENVLRDTLSRVIDEPRVVIRVHNDLLDTLQSRMSSVTEQCGFPGSVILLSEPDIQIPDCRIEWADGGAEFDNDAILTEIDELIERYRAGIGADTPDDTGTDDVYPDDVCPDESAESGADPQHLTEAPPAEQIDIEEQTNG